MRDIATDFIRRGVVYPRPPEPVHRPFQRERVNLSPAEKAQISHDLERSTQFSCRSIRILAHTRLWAGLRPHLVGLLRPLVLALAVLLIFAHTAFATTVYLSEQQALDESFGADASVSFTTLRLSAEQVASFEEKCGRRLYDRYVRIFRAHVAGELVGYAQITEEIGKYRPITFMVSTDPMATVQRVDIMVYRESHGQAVRRRRFLNQYGGKRLSDPIRRNADIISISGATLSVRAVNRGVRKALTFLTTLVTERPQTSPPLPWHPYVSKSAEPELEPRTVPESESELETEPKTGATAPLRRMRYAMGTVLEIAAFGPDHTAITAMNHAFTEVERLEAQLSTYRTSSEISRVNAHATKRPVHVSPATLACVQAALDAAARTGGAFDPTMRSGGWEQVKINAAARTIAFTDPQIRLDLGGIGKGFALDAAATILKHHGITSALLDFGGQLLALDPPPGQRGWAVAIEDPRKPGELIAVCELHHASLATSSRRERGDHIVDPISGKAASGLLSSTAAAPSACSADALSTALYVGGPAGIERISEAYSVATTLVVAPEAILTRRTGPQAPTLLFLQDRSRDPIRSHTGLPASP